MNSQIKLISAAQLASIVPTEYLGDTKFITQGFNVVFGASGSFKSFYVLGQALSIAQTAPVVYIAAEGAGGLHRRVCAWTEHYKQPAAGLNFICQEINLLKEDTVKALMKLIGPVKPQLLIFDTLARCMVGGDENSAKDMGIAIQNTSIIQREIGCAVTWVHHTNRADRGERGSGALRGAADSMIELTANGDNVIRVACSKVKDDEPWETEELRFRPIDSSGVLLPSTTFDSTKLSAQEMQILEFLGLEIFDSVGAKAVQIINGLNLSERSIYRTLSHLKRELTISHGSRGDPYCLTQKGKSLICKTTAKSAKVLNLVKEEFIIDTALTAS